MSGSKNDKFSRVTPHPVLVRWRVVLHTEMFSSSTVSVVVLVIFVSKNMNVMGVIAFVLD